MPNIKRIAITSERSVVFWDPRQKLKSTNDSPMVTFNSFFNV